LVIEIYPSPRIPQKLLDIFFKLIKAGFSQKRKTLRNSLASGLSISTTQSTELLSRAGIDPMRRAETLSIEEWQRLCENV
jgi:16S rRNA (adenine1518-N6/adenine1519-N6)-dimethyltransferase